jgi:hypothetical protein
MRRVSDPPNEDDRDTSGIEEPATVQIRPLSEHDRVQLAVTLLQALSAEDREEVLSQLGEQRRTLRFLAILVVVAGIAVAAGILADNTAFWGAAGTVFLLATAALVFYAAKGIGVLSEVLEVARKREGGS